MKLNPLVAACLACAGGGFAATDKDGHGHDQQALHGVVVAEVKDVDYELVAQPALSRLYLRDDGKPADVSKANAKLTLLSGAEMRPRP